MKIRNLFIGLALCLSLAGGAQAQVGKEMKAFRNGVEIQRTALVDPMEGYEQSSDQIDVLPGSGMTVTVAYEVPSWDGDYTVQLTQINDASVVHDEMAVTDPQ